MALGNIREILDFECLESYNVPEYIVTLNIEISYGRKINSMMIKLMMKQIIITFVVAVIICREFNNLMSNLLGWSGYFNRNVNRITRYSRDILVRC